MKNDHENPTSRQNKSSSFISYKRMSSTADEKYRSSLKSDTTKKGGSGGSGGSGFSVSSHILSSSSIRIPDPGRNSDLAGFMADQEKEEITEELNRQTMGVAGTQPQRSQSKTFRLEAVPEISFEDDGGVSKLWKKNATELFDFLRRSGVSDQPKDDSSSSPLTRNSHGGVAPRPDSQSDASLNVFSLEDTGENDAFFVVHESHYGNSPRGTTPEMIAAVTENELSGSTDSKNIEKLRTIRQESLDWELISRSEMHAVCGIPPGGSFRQETLDEELPLPSLIGKTLMLSESRLRDLMRNLPTRAEGCLNMRLSYSTSQHGFSLATLYRRCKRDIEDRPCILLINSQGAPEDSCFGAILSHSMHFSDHYYGNGETRLVRWGPQLEISEWSGENNYILKGGCKTFMIGSSNGRVAVWLDEDLYRGRSQVCDTFNMREPLTHDGKEDFTIENLEVWTFH